VFVCLAEVTIQLQSCEMAASSLCFTIVGTRAGRPPTAEISQMTTEQLVRWQLLSSFIAICV